MNLYQVPDPLPEDEQFDLLIPDRGVRIERIVSAGQTTPEDDWYDQNQDEWVALLRGEATLEYADGRRRHLCPGDQLFIPAHQKHRVVYTSTHPPCIWIAVHGPLQ